MKRDLMALLPSETVAPLAASHLSGQHIGEIVSFHWTMPGGGRTQAVVTGELRQVYHTSAQTVLNLCSHLEDSMGELDEFVLEPEIAIDFWRAAK